MRDEGAQSKRQLVFMIVVRLALGFLMIALLIGGTYELVRGRVWGALRWIWPLWVVPFMLHSGGWGEGGRVYNRDSCQLVEGPEGEYVVRSGAQRAWRWKTDRRQRLEAVISGRSRWGVTVRRKGEPFGTPVLRKFVAEVSQAKRLADKIAADIRTGDFERKVRTTRSDAAGKPKSL